MGEERAGEREVQAWLPIAPNQKVVGGQARGTQTIIYASLGTSSVKGC